MKRDPVVAYYKRRMSGGKSPVARALDFFALRALFFTACLLYFRSVSNNLVVSLFLAAVATAVLCIVLHLVHQWRLERFILRQRQRLYEQYLRERLMLLPRDQFLVYARRHLNTLPGYRAGEGEVTFRGQPCRVHVIQQPEPLVPGALLGAYRAARAAGAARLAVFSAGPVPEVTHAFCRRILDVAVEVFPPEALVRLLSQQREPDEEQRIDAIIQAEIDALRAQRAESLKNPVGAGRARRYLFAAGFLLVGSFFTAYALYYRIASGLCLALAIATAILRHRRMTNPPVDQEESTPG